MTTPTLTFTLRCNSSEFTDIQKSYGSRRVDTTSPKGTVCKGLVTLDATYSRPAGPDQRVTIRAVQIAIWHPTQVTESVTVTVPIRARQPDLGLTEADIAAAAKKARIAVMSPKRCQHADRRLVKLNKRRGYREWVCNGCGDQIVEDSGD